MRSIIITSLEAKIWQGKLILEIAVLLSSATKLE